jgi:hypothetical protein
MAAILAAFSRLRIPPYITWISEKPGRYSATVNTPLSRPFLRWTARARNRIARSTSSSLIHSLQRARGGMGSRRLVSVSGLIGTPNSSVRYGCWSSSHACVDAELAPRELAGRLVDDEPDVQAALVRDLHRRHLNVDPRVGGHSAGHAQIVPDRPEDSVIDQLAELLSHVLRRDDGGLTPTHRH